MNQNKENFMSKYLVIAAALVVLAVACNKKETAAPAEGTTVEQTTPVETAPEAMPNDTHEAMPSDEAPVAE
jgi:hypothetical protein